MIQAQTFPVFAFGSATAKTYRRRPRGNEAALWRRSGFLVLPHRIELWTSPLPRECSTTELRQRRKRAARGAERRGNCHSRVAGARIAGLARPRFLDCVPCGGDLLGVDRKWARTAP